MGRYPGGRPVDGSIGNMQLKNIVALSVDYSYHGFMTFWTAVKRAGYIDPSSQLKAALSIRTVAM